MGRRAADIRKKVYRAFRYQEVHVAVQLKSLSRFVHLKRFLEELNDNE